MEEYRVKLKKRCIWLAVIMLAAVAMVAISYVGYLKLDMDSHDASFVRGFQCGLFFAWAVLVLKGIVDVVKALKSENNLKKQYIKEHDERSITVRREAKATAYWVGLLALILGAVIAGFYDFTVFYTLLAVLLFMSVVSIVCKIVYSRKI